MLPLSEGFFSGLVVRNSVELATADSTVGITRSLDVVVGAVVLSTDTSIAMFGTAPDNYISLIRVVYVISPLLVWLVAISC